jgi:hypothetical protein
LKIGERQEEHEEGETEEYGISICLLRREPSALTSTTGPPTNYGKERYSHQGCSLFRGKQDMSYLFEQAGPQRN